MTKYQMALRIGKVFGLSADHVSGDASAPPPDAPAKRPKDVTLDRSRLESLGISSHVPFDEGIADALKAHV